MQETIVDLIRACEHRVRYAIPGYSPVQALEALAYLNQGKLGEAATRRVEPKWAYRVAMVMLSQVKK